MAAPSRHLGIVIGIVLLFVAVVGGALAIYASVCWFFARRVRAIVRYDLHYGGRALSIAEVTPVSLRIRKRGGNHYDAAIEFLLSRLSTLPKPWTRYELESISERVRLMIMMSDRATNPKVIGKFVADCGLMDALVEAEKEDRRGEKQGSESNFVLIQHVCRTKDVRDGFA